MRHYSTDRDDRPDSAISDAEIGYVCWGIRQIAAAGLLADYRLTLARELAAHRQRDCQYIWHDDGAGDIAADLLAVDRERCRRIAAAGARAAIVRREIDTYLAMIEQRRQREAERDSAIAAERQRRSRVIRRATA